jgi:hypothetical protein
LRFFAAAGRGFTLSLNTTKPCVPDVSRINSGTASNRWGREFYSGRAGGGGKLTKKTASSAKSVGETLHLEKIKHL